MSSQEAAHSDGSSANTADERWVGSQGQHGQDWELRKRVDGYELLTQRTRTMIALDEIERMSIRRRWLILRELVIVGRSTARYRGLSRRAAKSLSASLRRSALRERVSSELRSIIEWNDAVEGCMERAVSNSRWIPEECIEALIASRPNVDTARWFAFRAGEELEAALSDEDRAAIELFARDLPAWAADINEAILQRELIDRRDFFDLIETSPLTDEQARAVVCFDNRVNVVASAGSGKTSVMVARAAYAIERGFVPPERILLLAFNKAAAVELQDRVSKRLTAVGLPSAGLRASTFHSFGLGVIGDATGRKPRLAAWLDGGQDVGMVMRIVDELRGESMSFRFKWDMYRLLFARISEDSSNEEELFDAWDKVKRRSGFRTYGGEVVKSQGERLIADWLFLNGVDYEYERPYSVDVATSSRSQYRPDFYYPTVDVWHEHWAIGHDGKPPRSFMGYAEGMAWKRTLHATHGTTLVETKWADIIDTSGFSALADELTALGLQLEWNPDRPIPGAKPVDNKELARLIRTFMAHVKSNSLTRETMQARLQQAPNKLRTQRTKLFLALYWEIHDRWQAKLDADDSVDFEDMLVRAADYVEDGSSQPHYDLVLVDEFQDASQARARLIAALVKPPGKYLLAVGDDWQAINRFAGADISVMTKFERRFGKGQVLNLQTTFRCTQEICDVSSAFVSKNPRQLIKQVQSAQPDRGERVLSLAAASTEAVPAAIRAWLDGLAADVSSGRISPRRDDVVTVDVLGRYNFDRDLVPDWSAAGVRVTFRTIHKSKGLEADYVIVPNLGRGRYGFPSQIADDPVLELAMSQAEDFPHSEERRLLYVALTRARRQAVLIGVAGAESPFLIELINDGLVTADPESNRPATSICPECREGTLVSRSGPYGAFYGCTSFPRCRHTAQYIRA
ncbi:UvrD-helicase domain-containing protein [Aeromicrobium sp. NPDC092404]|uniref:UvrD-helicase domain-containing protein n=1 Tax=Aeromicrobium sp. NPDC092404 TaxID=3154976 RepID=UPI003440620B